MRARSRNARFSCREVLLVTKSDSSLARKRSQPVLAVSLKRLFGASSVYHVGGQLRADGPLLWTSLLPHKAASPNSFRYHALSWPSARAQAVHDTSQIAVSGQCTSRETNRQLGGHSSGRVLQPASQRISGLRRPAHPRIRSYNNQLEGIHLPQVLLAPAQEGFRNVA